MREGGIIREWSGVSAAAEDRQNVSTITREVSGHLKSWSRMGTGSRREMQIVQAVSKR